MPLAAHVPVWPAFSNTTNGTIGVRNRENHFLSVKLNGLGDAEASVTPLVEYVQFSNYSQGQCPFWQSIAPTVSEYRYQC